MKFALAPLLTALLACGPSAPFQTAPPRIAGLFRMPERFFKVDTRERLIEFTISQGIQIEFKA